VNENDGHWNDFSHHEDQNENEDGTWVALQYSKNKKKSPASQPRQPNQPSQNENERP